MKGSLVLISAFCFLLVSESSHAQVHLEDVSLSYGVLNGVSQRHFVNPKDTPFGEIEVGFRLANLSKAGMSLSSTLNAGYWRQRAPTKAPCIDCRIYSYRTPTFGLRMVLGLDHAPVPLELLLGYTRHYVLAQYEYGAGISGDIGSDYTTAFEMIELGTRVSAHIVGQVGLGFELLKLHNLPNVWDEGKHRGWRLALRTTYDVN
jgi:hypothetical protein